jgi:hypothetical protein
MSSWGGNSIVTSPTFTLRYVCLLNIMQRKYVLHHVVRIPAKLPITTYACIPSDVATGFHTRGIWTRQVSPALDPCQRESPNEYLSILGNIYKVAFWASAHLTYDPALLESIRTEVLPAMRDGDLGELYLAEQCPKLESFISEILRLTTPPSKANCNLGLLHPSLRILAVHHQGSSIGQSEQDSFINARYTIRYMMMPIAGKNLV